jgi:hypothetical protein
MKPKELFDSYVNSKNKEREIGHYYASEVGQIIKGYLKPKDFFTPKKINEFGIKNIMSGMAFEAEFKRALGDRKFIHEPRKEIHITKDIFIVVKPDFLFDEFLLETKFPAKIGTPDEYLERYKYQMECEYRAFGKKVMLGIFSHPFDLKIYRYKESKKVWEEIQEAIIKFDKELKKIHGRKKE